jgi:hypothetical protein
MRLIIAPSLLGRLRVKTKKYKYIRMFCKIALTHELRQSLYLRERRPRITAISRPERHSRSPAWVKAFRPAARAWLTMAADRVRRNIT